MRLLDVNIIAHLQRADRATEIGSTEKAEDSGISLRHTGLHSSQIISRERPLFEPHCDSEQQSVLCEIVQLIELPEEMPNPVPTFVWFDFIESFNRIFPEQLYFSSELGRHVFSGSLS